MGGAGVTDGSTTGSIIGITINGKTATSRRARATSRSMSRDVEPTSERRTSPAVTASVDGEPSGVGSSSSRSVPVSSSPTMVQYYSVAMIQGATVADSRRSPHPAHPKDPEA